jgi:hypothetical protein
MDSCSLDATGGARQGQRYAAAGRSLEWIERDGLRLEARFSPDLDRPTLEEALAVERECCPFFEIAYDVDARRLRFSVADESHAPALAAIEAALSA